MVVSWVLGGLALLGAGFFSAELVASLAEPLALILAGASGAIVFIKLLRQGILSDYFSSDEGEFIGAGLAGATAFFLVFVATQMAIVSLSPLAGVLVVGLGVAVFLFGPGILFDLIDLVLVYVGGD